MPYIEERYKFKNSIEIERKHTGRYGAPGRGRQKRKKPTPEEIRENNQRQRAKGMRRLIKENFQPNDYWTTLTYAAKCNPPPEQAKKDINRFIRQLRTQYKKLGAELKYIIKTEYTKRGVVHHHLIINRVMGEKTGTDILIRKLWDHGNPDNKLLYEQGDYQKLAEYIVKQDEEKTKGSSRYSRSRNLVVPKPEIRELKRKTWKKDAKPWKGYYIEKDSIREGTNPITGFRYQHFTMIKIKRRE